MNIYKLPHFYNQLGLRRYSFLLPIPCFFCVHVNSPGHRGQFPPDPQRSFIARNSLSPCSKQITYIFLFPLQAPIPVDDRPRTLTGMLFLPPTNLIRDPRGEHFLTQSYFHLCKK